MTLIKAIVNLSAEHVQLISVVNKLVLNGAAGQTAVLLLLGEGCYPSPAACSTIYLRLSDFKVKELSA